MNTKQSLNRVDLLIKFSQYNRNIDDDLKNLENKIVSVETINDYYKFKKDYLFLEKTVEDKKKEYSEYEDSIRHIEYLYVQIVPKFTSNVLNEFIEYLKIIKKKFFLLKSIVMPYIKSIEKIQNFLNFHRFNPEYSFCRKRIINKSGIFT